jgi:hypothetical protein
MGKKTRAPDYRLLIAPHTNERTDSPTTLIVLETAQSFAAFRYELSVDEERTETSLTLRVRGLRTPSLSIPEPGHASYAREYDGLRGTLAVSVIGLDGTASRFTVRIAPGRVELVTPPAGGALTVVTSKAQWKD